MATPTPERTDVLTARDPLRAPTVTRRLILQGGLTGAVAAGLGARTAAYGQASQIGPATAAGGVLRDDILTLVNHVTQGFTRASYEEAKSLGFEGYLESQLDHENIPDVEMDAVLAQFPTLTMTSKELFDTYGPPAGGNGIQPLVELRAATVLRSIISKRQLFERMVEFWTNHFNVYHLDNPLRILKTAEDRDVIRAHALGNFGDLLLADARSGAMIVYLDNIANTVGNTNENYAREVMELHTFGVDGPYTEQDIQELARVFTGWTIFPPPNQSYGNFRFAVGAHDNGPKSLLGLNIPAGGGVGEGETVLAFLATHVKTADFIARKMAAWLLSYDPPQSLVDRVARTFLSTGGDIKSMVREIMSPQSFAEYHPIAHPKLRRPGHFVNSVLRATGATINAPGGIIQSLALMGHIPFDWLSPDGYPDSIEAWGHAVLPRWDFAARVFRNQVPGVQITGPQLFGLIGGAPQAEVARAIDEVLMGGAMSATDVAEVQEYVDSYPNLTGSVLRDAFALAASSPSFQYY
ncbi:MAG: DUF1800 domain-containing protein [Planctomycetota bacterium]|nr:MAG: DUF1800 domain-containing protein [Planctomycetota bacterium]